VSADVDFGALPRQESGPECRATSVKIMNFLDFDISSQFFSNLIDFENDLASNLQRASCLKYIHPEATSELKKDQLSDLPKIANTLYIYRHINIFFLKPDKYQLLVPNKNTQREPPRRCRPNSWATGFSGKSSCAWDALVDNAVT
jgi:hypothetical protein